MSAVDGPLEVSCGTNGCIAFSMTGEYLEAGSGTLVTLTYLEIADGSDLSLSNLIVSGFDGVSPWINGPGTVFIPECNDNEDDGICDIYDVDDDDDGVDDG